jgi:predicted NBD/HSP70 family sugar kinase
MRGSTSQVLRAIATYGPVSRAQLARDLALSGPTLTQATKFLLDRGLITEVEQSPSTGGRPATLLGLVADAGKVIGLKLSADRVVGVCVNLESEIEWDFEEPFESRGDQAIAQLTTLLMRQSKKVRGQLLGIGIGIPGVVSPKDSSTADSVMLGWSNVNVGHQISESLSTPVLLENDVNTLAIAESLFGRGRDTSNFLTVTLGRGIGLGIVINGELYSGSHGAGEIGHVTAILNGPKCECGKNGCLEAIASSPAIVTKAINDGILAQGDSMDKLLGFARGDEKLAARYFKEPAELVGVALANVINIFGPELVLFGGEGVEAWDLWEPWLKSSLTTHVVSSMDKYTLEVDPWDDAKWALGATALILQASLGDSSVENPISREVAQRLQVSPRLGARVS